MQVYADIRCFNTYLELNKIVYQAKLVTLYSFPFRQKSISYDPMTQGKQNVAVTPNTSLKLLDDKVEVIPSVVRKQPRVKAERDLGVVLFRALPGEVLRLACERVVNRF